MYARCNNSDGVRDRVYSRVRDRDRGRDRDRVRGCNVYQYPKVNDFLLFFGRTHDKAGSEINFFSKGANWRLTKKLWSPNGRGWSPKTSVSFFWFGCINFSFYSNSFNLR